MRAARTHSRKPLPRALRLERALLKSWDAIGLSRQLSPSLFSEQRFELFFAVPRGGIEPSTRGFSILCSTNMPAPTGPCSAVGLRAVCLPPIAGSAACSLVLGRLERVLLKN